MTDMIDRVAKAILKARAPGQPKKDWSKVAAEAAILAMREPTDRMCDMGEGFNLRCGCLSCDHSAWEMVRAGYQAMIDDILNKRED